MIDNAANPINRKENGATTAALRRPGERGKVAFTRTSRVRVLWSDELFQTNSPTSPYHLTQMSP